MSLELPRSLKGFTRPQSVLLVGCGGTGAYVAGHLARLIQVLNESLHRFHEITLAFADGDVVEKKNLARQHFVGQDLGLNKAGVLAQRYSTAFGMEIRALEKDIESADEIDEALRAGQRGNVSGLVIGCVDNNASRRVIDGWFRQKLWHWSSSKFWIDSGNEEHGGQVVCGYNTGSSPPPMGPRQAQDLFCLPSASEVYPELMEGEARFNSELSCAERAASAPQNMMTNVTAATLVMNYAQKVILQEPIASHGTVFNIGNVYRTLHNLGENLSKVHPDRLSGWEKPSEAEEDKDPPQSGSYTQ